MRPRSPQTTTSLPRYSIFHAVMMGVSMVFIFSAGSKDRYVCWVTTGGWWSPWRCHPPRCCSRWTSGRWCRWMSLSNSGLVFYWFFVLGGRWVRVEVQDGYCVIQAAHSDVGLWCWEGCEGVRELDRVYLPEVSWWVIHQHFVLLLHIYFFIFPRGKLLPWTFLPRKLPQA